MFEGRISGTPTFLSVDKNLSFYNQLDFIVYLPGPGTSNSGAF